MGVVVTGRSSTLESGSILTKGNSIVDENQRSPVSAFEDADENIVWEAAGLTEVI